jgi:hypothetical protein
MSFIADRVYQTATNPGSGSVTPNASVAGYATFSSGVPNGSTLTIAIESQTPGDWELCDAVWDGTTLTRGLLISSSTGSRVLFSGPVNVFSTASAKYINTPAGHADTLGFTSTSSTAIATTGASGTAGTATITFASTASGGSSSITGTVLTVGGTVTGTFRVGMTLSGTGVSASTVITSILTGTGGAGTYSISQTQTVSTTPITGTITAPPYAIDSYISVTSIVPTGYNGFYQVTGCTTSSVSYANATTAAQTTAGQISQTALLTNTSSFYQYITGTSTQSSFALPDTSTLQQGWSYRINNGAPGSTMSVYSSTGALLASVPQNSAFYFTCIDTTVNTAAAWRFGITESGAFTGTGNLVLSVSPTITGTLNFTGSTASNAFFGTSQTTGQMQIGGTSQTGLIRLGQSTASQPIQIGMGATATSTTASGTASSISSTTLTVGGTVTGTFSIGMTLSGTNVLPGTYITAGSGTSWTVNQTQTVASTTITGRTQKSIDIGTGGASGSITEITLGSATSGSTSTTSINGKLNTGALNVAAGSSGVNISNGNTVTAITAPVSGSGYTSIPTVAITAPTTAGGVQATASALMFTSSATIASGGTGYTVGDTLTIVGGTTAVTVGTYTVSTVSGGVITSVTRVTGSGYSVLPSNPVSVTGGTGSSATLNLTWTVSGFTITNAGSGYVEQPTVTFSGGGGSGAAAYASVGTNAVLSSIGSALRLANAGGLGFQVGNAGTATVNYLSAQGSSAGNAVLLSASGADSNIAVRFSSLGTSPVSVFTNNSGQEQLRVLHTASAVNFVQVTGAATGNRPTISVQGSDANINMDISAKGFARMFFLVNGARNAEFTYGNQAAGVNGNYVKMFGNAAGTAPVYSVEGSDTNIDLALTPKGTGSVVVNSPIRIDTHLVIDAVTATTSTTTADQVLATFDATLYRTIKLTVQAADGTNYQSTELLAVHNGTTVNHTEYGTVTVGSACASYTVDYSSATVRLRATPASATATTYRIAAYLTRV